MYTIIASLEHKHCNAWTVKWDDKLKSINAWINSWINGFSWIYKINFITFFKNILNKYKKLFNNKKNVNRLGVKCITMVIGLYTAQV